MKDETKKILTQLIERYPELNCLEGKLMEAIDKTVEVINLKGKILVCGNGGN